ncbi:hypothetical protein BCR44DRAFT_125315 [Catenaria anguillulae PL171]|uniref:Angiotensin-converting enzyme n=1 Tax=Catenaria anguillulae PL171 TaxID=765915 RepID=A0A1Y2I4N0_9FUNG|nr:hypothetical protein BCR44DRAFT_125315 [Catenaria anguillulae PL171]
MSGDLKRSLHSGADALDVKKPLLPTSAAPAGPPAYSPPAHLADHDRPFRHKPAISILALLTAILLVGLTVRHLSSTCPMHAPPRAASPVTAFLARIDRQVTAMQTTVQEAAWAYETNITDFNLQQSTKAALQLNALMLQLKAEGDALDMSRATPSEKRQLELLAHRIGGVLKDPKDQAQMAELVGNMQGLYGAATYKGKPLEPALTETISTARDWDELADVYIGWRNVTGPSMRESYEKYIGLANKAAREAGFKDMADQWLGEYEMDSSEMQDLVEDLWDQVYPLYQQLHCHVRRRLARTYGADRFASDNLIPAHLLGNMWAQQWGNIADLVLPYPDIPSIDVGPALRAQNYTAERMHKLAEDFYKSLGMQSLPPTFWTKSMLTKPADGRPVVCHASAWDVDTQQDVRIKMCTVPTADDLVTVHHEQGHLYYDLAYAHQPLAFREGAADFFHEAIGDAVALSLTPKHLQDIGLIPKDAKATDEDEDEKRALNDLMRIALEKLAFLPFGYLVDKWRWDVARGTISPQDYNKGWWDLVQEIQGMKSPAPRPDTAGLFDPGAKFHVAANVPYLRYFLAHLLEFQLHRSMCRAAGHDGALHACSVYGSKAAGEQLAGMLRMGASRPWVEALAKGTGGREWEVDASALIQYLEPLLEWLQQQNEGEVCEWEMPEGSKKRKASNGGLKEKRRGQHGRRHRRHRRRHHRKHE